MVSEKAVRIYDLPQETTGEDLLRFAVQVAVKTSSKTHFWPKRANDPDNARDLTWSLAQSNPFSVATILFPCEQQKKVALRHQTYRNQIDDHFLDITVLHSPASADVDVCAVHGLNGNAFDTWKANKMWLRDMLPTTEPFSTSRIMTFGYSSGLNDRKTTSGVPQWAEALLRQVSLVRQSAQEQTRPILFICHSLGGLVAREAMIRLGQFPNLYPGLSLSQCGLLFLSTPHSGATGADWNRLLLAIAEFAFGVRQRELVDRLQSFNWPGVASKELFASLKPRPPFDCLCESEGMSLPGGYRQIVLKDSAGLNEVTAESIPNVNHSTICKFNSFSPAYRTVVDRLARLRTKVLASDSTGGAGSSQPAGQTAQPESVREPPLQQPSAMPAHAQSGEQPSTDDRSSEARADPPPAPAHAMPWSIREPVYQGGSVYGQINAGKVLSGNFTASGDQHF